MQGGGSPTVSARSLPYLVDKVMQISKAYLSVEEVVLRSLVAGLEPARLNGLPVAATFRVMIEFLISPYPGGLVITEEPDRR